MTGRSDPAGPEETSATRRALLGVGAALCGGCLRLTAEQQPAGGPGTERTGSPASGSTPTTNADVSPASRSGTADGTAADGIVYPPGVGDDGVTVALAFEHRALVSGTSCTVTVTEERRHGTERIRRRIADGSRAHVIREDDGGSVEEWLTGDVAYARAEERGGTVYDLDREYYFDRRHLTGTRLLEPLLETGTFVPTGVEERDGTPLVRIEADGADSDAIARRFGGDSIAAFDGEGFVTEEGLVRRLTATYAIERPDETLTRRTEIRTGAVGDTDVSAPTWIETAAERAPRFEAGLVDDGAFVELSHVGGDGVPVGVSVNLSAMQGESHRHTYLDGGIEAGETLYFYEQGGEELGVARGAVPAVDPEPFGTDHHLAVFAGPLDLLETTVSP